MPNIRRTDIRVPRDCRRRFARLPGRKRDCASAPAPYSPIVSSEALPPAAVVLMVSVRSPAKRSR